MKKLRRNAMPEAWLDDARSVAMHLHIRPPAITMGNPWFMGRNAGLTLPNDLVLVHPKALRLPNEVRRYLLAHEMGHIRHWHAKRAFLAFIALVLLFAVNPALCGLIGWTYIFAVLVPYGLGDRAEREVLRVLGTSITPQRKRRWMLRRALAQAQTERERRAIASEQGCRLQGPETGGDGVAGE